MCRVHIFGELIYERGLKERGYKTTIEHARHYIDTQQITGKNIGEIRHNQRAFQEAVLDMQIAQEARLPPGEIIFLDRALPDALAYYRFLNFPPHEKLTQALRNVYYRKIFILDLLPLALDYARTEDAEAQKRIQQLLTEVYESLPFPVVHVPALSQGERVDFILKHL